MNITILPDLLIKKGNFITVNIDLKDKNGIYYEFRFDL